MLEDACQQPAAAVMQLCTCIRRGLSAYSADVFYLHGPKVRNSCGTITRIAILHGARLGFYLILKSIMECLDPLC